jgi:hypothetical protein
MNSERHDRRIDSLILDLLEWLATEPRPYSEVIDAWGTSCAKLPVWEEAVDRGLVASELATPAGVLVRVRSAGHMLLSEQHVRSTPAGIVRFSRTNILTGTNSHGSGS